MSIMERKNEVIGCRDRSRTCYLKGMNLARCRFSTLPDRPELLPRSRTKNQTNHVQKKGDTENRQEVRKSVGRVFFVPVLYDTILAPTKRHYKA